MWIEMLCCLCAHLALEVLNVLSAKCLNLIFSGKRLLMSYLVLSFHHKLIATTTQRSATFVVRLLLHVPVRWQWLSPPQRSCYNLNVGTRWHNANIEIQYIGAGPLGVGPAQVEIKRCSCHKDRCQWKYRHRTDCLTWTLKCSRSGPPPWSCYWIRMKSLHLRLQAVTLRYNISF